MENPANPANAQQPGHSQRNSQTFGPPGVPFTSPQQPPSGNGFGAQMHRRTGTGGHGSNGGAIYTRETSTGTKNTSHVPCRFYMVGNCQAGKACPFSHATENINNPAPCKYFAKGNCKYGYRCANPHLMADGTDARKLQHIRQPCRQDNRVPFNIGPPAEPGYPEQNQQVGYPPLPSPRVEPTQRYDVFGLSSHERSLSNLQNESRYSSHPPSQYGSPSNESRYLPTSPPMSALDATIPPTFDSNGAINFAFDGPASLPSRFGLGPSSATSSTTNTQAFANLDFMARRDVSESYSRSNFLLGSSPPGSNDHGFPNRVLHSDRLRQSDKLGSSLPMSRPIPRTNATRPFPDEESDEENFDLLPHALSDEIMTPQEKMRRFSRYEEETSARHSLSKLVSPPESKLGSPKFGSPPTGASPSGWGPIFARKPRDDMTGNELMGSPSRYGHVGSPLRNSSLHNEGSPAIRAINRPPDSGIPGDVSPFGMSSPPSGRGTSAVGMLSQQLKNTRLRDSSNGLENIANQSLQPPNQSIRNTSQSLASTSGTGATNASRLDRATSNSSISRSDRIDEEPSIFEMDEEDLRRREQEKQKRLSGNIRGFNPWNDTPSDVGDLGGRSSPSLGLKMLGRGSSNGLSNGR